jgi:hypothetical protein
VPLAQYISAADAALVIGTSESQLFLLSSAVGGPIECIGEGSGRAYLRTSVENYRSSEAAAPLAETWLEPFADGCFSESEFPDDSHVIRNVLLCGNKSRNGYDIPPSAFGGEANAKKLYTDMPVFLDHERGKEFSRSVRDMGGTIKNVRMIHGQPRGDIDTESCPAGPALMALARKRTPFVGLSHIAAYRWSPDKKTVVKVEHVVSVDVVFRPATTSGFHEQTQTPRDSESIPMFLPGSGYRFGYGS